MTNPDILDLIEKVETIRSKPGDSKDYEEYTDGWIDACNSVLDLIHSGLTQPEPVAPTDEEIEEWADAAKEVPLEMDLDIHGWRRCFTAKEFSETIRAVLAKWGTPANNTREENLDG